MKKVNVFLKHLMLHLFTACMGAMAIYMAYQYNWYMTIVCGSITFLILALHQYDGDKQYRRTPEYRNHRLSEVLKNVNQIQFKKGTNFWMNGLQLEVLEVRLKPDTDVISHIRVAVNMKDVPREPFSLSYPHLLPYGGAEYEQNEKTLKQAYQSLINNKPDHDNDSNTGAE